MNAWEILLPTALVAMIAAAIRLARRPQRTTAAAVLGLMFLAACLALNTPAIYEFVDPIVGATNVVYLLVQLTFVAAMFFMKASLAPRVSSDGRIQQFPRADVVLVIATIVLVTVCFLAAPTPISAYRVGPYRELWQIIIATQLVNIYSAYTAIAIVRETLFKARSPRQPRSVRIGSAILCLGFTIGVATALTRFMLLVPFTTGTPELQESLVAIDGYFVAGTVACIVAGWACIFVSNRRPTPTTSRSTR